MIKSTTELTVSNLHMLFILLHSFFLEPEDIFLPVTNRFFPRQLQLKYKACFQFKLAKTILLSLFRYFRVCCCLIDCAFVPSFFIYFQVQFSQSHYETFLAKMYVFEPQRSENSKVTVYSSTNSLEILFCTHPKPVKLFKQLAYSYI